MSNSVRPHRRQPTRLCRPWDSPGKNTGVGCHCLLQCMKVKSENEVAQSCPTLSDPMDWSLPGSSLHGIFQARVLEWGAIALLTIKKKWQLCSVKKVLANTVVVMFLQYINILNQHFTHIQCCACVHAKLLQLCSTLCHPMGCSPPGSSVHGIIQTRILEWVAMPSSRGPSQSRDWTHVSYVPYIGRQVLYHQWHLEMPYNVICQLYLSKDGQLRGWCGPCLEWKIFPTKM